MSVFPIAYYTLLRNIKNWKLILLLIGVPLLAYITTANVITNVNYGPKVEKTKVAYFDDDGGAIAERLNQFLHTKEILTSFEVQKVTSVDEGTRLITTGITDDFIYFKNDFSPSYKEGKKFSIAILSNRDNSPTRLIVESFINSVNAFTAIHSNGLDSKVWEVSSGIKQIAVSPSGKILRDADKYSFLGMLEMLSYGALLGCFSVVNSIKKNTLIRFEISPINSLAYVSGKFMGNFLTLCPTIALFIVYLYQQWGLSMQKNILTIIMAFLLFTVIITALGMIVGYLTKKTGLGVLITVCLVGFLSAAAFVQALGTAQGFLKWILFLSPQNHIYTIFTDTLFEGLSRIHGSLISLAILATVLTTLTLLLGGRKAV
ncbi:ABC transporter permease [Desulfosporosinus sp. FKB]|uniref:ABC transporter permease n=1 Tax=Desulfosporosinus sp. FKB TaxID=1969835 RepID=UPI000B49C12C|nr:ABC transporter permease [Desulfosporosinus sp. FKB]